MAWPVTRSDGFHVDANAWNEVVNALPAWGGNVNAGGNNLSDLNQLNVATIAPRSGTTISFAGGIAVASSWQDPNGVRPNFLNVNLTGTASGFSQGAAIWVNSLPTFSSIYDTVLLELAVRHGALGGSGTGHMAAAKCLSVSAACSGGAVIDSAYGLLVGALQATNAWAIYDNSATKVYFSSKVGIGTDNPTVSGTGKFHHTGDTVRIVGAANAPANSAATGNLGEVRLNGAYLYYHDGTDWRRVAGATF